jgi:hypothetical protein
MERLNKMFGWVIDRSEVGKPGEFANLSDEAVREEIKRRLEARGMSSSSWRCGGTPFGHP